MTVHTVVVWPGVVVRELVIPDRATLESVSVQDDIAGRIEAVRDRWGNGDELPDIGGPLPADRREKYRRRLTAARREVEHGRRTKTLGWDSLLKEELWEALTAEDDGDRYDELLDLIAGASLMAEALKRRQK
ncbi:hypothetical protein [Amycolatopsis sp. NPDC003731]